MPLNPSQDAWSAGVTLTRAEYWQCRLGRLHISTDDVPDEGNSAELISGQGVELAAGVTVYHKAAIPGQRAAYSRLGLEA